MLNRWTPPEWRASVTRPMSGSDRPFFGRFYYGVAASLIVLVAMVAYAASLRGAWVYDDWPGIVENDTLRSLSQAWRPPGDSGSPIAGRPLVNVSFAANFALSGTRPWSYHFVNVFIHAAAALLVYGLARKTLDFWRGTNALGGAGEFVAFSISLLWAVHPLNTEAVAYVAQRAESLMSFCYLLTLYAFARGVANAEATTAPKRGWLALSIIACACGMAAKEVMVSAPIVVALYDRTFVAGSLVRAWRSRGRYYFALAATWAILAWLVLGNATRGGTVGFSSGAVWWQYATAQIAAQVWYLRLAVWPSPLVFDYGVVALPLTHALLACAVILGGLIGVTAVAMLRRWRSGWLGIAYFAVLAPSSSVLPIVTEPLAEHRMYLPLALLLAAGGAGAVVLVGRRLIYAVSIAAMAFTTLTVARERVYRSELALWTDTVAKAPENARAYYNLGQAEASFGRLRAARVDFETAVAKNPNFASAYSNLANTLQQLGDTAGALHAAATAVRLNPELAEAHNNLGNAMLVTGDPTGALREYATALRIAPASVDFIDNYATALANLGRFHEALKEFGKLVGDHPELPLLHFNYANTLARSGRFHEAIAEYSRTLSLDPNYPRAREYLARAQALDHASR